MLSPSLENEASMQQAALRQFVVSGQHQPQIYGLQWGDPRRRRSKGSGVVDETIKGVRSR